MREETLQVLRRNAWANRNVRAAIRAFCYECIGGSSAAIAECSVKCCPLYPFRLGMPRRRACDYAAELLREEGFPDLAERNETLRDSGAAAFRAFAGRDAGLDVQDDEDDGQDDVQEPIGTAASVPGKSKFVLRG